jgi:hypothetical protein
MAKKLCERPRTNDGWGRMDTYVRNNKIRVQELEEDEDGGGNVILDVDDSGRSRHPMSIGRGSKVLGENLAPLYRFLDKQVGRPWDKVYSEIREQVSANSATQIHILEHAETHVRGFQETLIIKEDGKIYNGNYGYELSNDELYIHPETKILCRYKTDKKKYLYKFWQNVHNVKEKDILKIEDCIYFAKMNGTWYEITYEQKWSHENYKLSFKSYFLNFCGHPLDFKYGYKLPYEKRAIPKNILKRMGLK